MDYIFSDDDLISYYSRADGIADGSLIHISGLMTDNGICRINMELPTNCDVAATYECYSLIPVKDYEHIFDFLQQSHRNRIRKLYNNSWLFSYDNGSAVYILKAVIHGGDNMEPAITLMLRNQD